MNDPTTMKHSALKAPQPGCKLVHIHPGAAQFGRLYQADLPILADPNLAAAALAALPVARRHFVVLAQAKAGYVAHVNLPPQPGPIDMAEVMRVLNAGLLRETTMTTGAQNASDWPNIHYC